MSQATQVTTRKNRLSRSRLEKTYWGYLFIAPFFLVYAIFQLYPLGNTFYLAFQKYMITGTNKVIGPNPIGFNNFAALFKASSGATPKVVQVFINTGIMWIINFIPQMLIALLLAKWFTDTRFKIHGQGAIKVMVYMPNIITAASISMLFYALFAFPQGPANSILASLGVIDKETYLNSGIAATVAFRFLEDGWAVRLIVAFINFWMWYGNTMIILIAGILGVNPSLFEAAQVDGASSNQIFHRITIPLLWPIILYTLVTSLIGGMQMYDIPAMMQQQGSKAKDMTQTVTMYIQELVFEGTKDYGRSAAVSVCLFLVTAVFSVILFYIMRDKEAGRQRRMMRAARKGAKL